MAYFVYILASKSRVLYAGMTNDLERRVRQHKLKQIAGFTAKYNVTRLVFFEKFATAMQAIEAEKKIKGLLRVKKIALIEAANPDWLDLTENREPSKDSSS